MNNSNHPAVYSQELLTHERKMEILSELLSRPAFNDQVGGDHYKIGVIQPNQVAELWNLPPNLEKVIKYIKRKKGGIKQQIEDLGKAQQCIQFHKEFLLAMCSGKLDDE